MTKKERVDRAGDGRLLLGRLFCRQVTRSPDRDLSLERMSDDRLSGRPRAMTACKKDGVVAECQAELSRNARAIIAPLLRWTLTKANGVRNQSENHRRERHERRKGIHFGGFGVQMG